MKKLLLVAAAAAFMTSATQAQDVLKQTGGENNLEVLFTPLGGSPIGINGIKYRRFLDPTIAIRANVFIGHSVATDIMLGTDGNGDAKELESISSDFQFSIAPGVEKHFAGTDRLSPYIGAEALIGFNAIGEKMDVDGTSDTETIKDKTLDFGLNALAGVDFYFADNIYLGAEIGFGFIFSTDLDTKFSSTADGVSDVETPNGSSFDVGPNAVAAIRAGFLF